MALSNFGIVVGEVSTIGILFYYTKSMNYYDAFFTVSLVIMSFSFFFLWAVKDPDFSVLRRSFRPNQDNMPESPVIAHSVLQEAMVVEPITSDFESRSCFGKITQLTSKVHQTLKKRPLIFICIVGAAIVRLFSVLFSIYLLLWIQTFSYDGVLESIDDSKTIYVQIMLISVLASSFLLPIVGSVIDRYQPTKIIPIAFTFRCFTTYLFWLLERPDTIRAYIVCVLMIVATIVEVISVDSVFNKSLPKSTRGLLNSVFSLVG